MKRLKAEGWVVEYLPLLADGRVCIDQLKERLNTSTSLIAQLVNSELGTHEPVKKLLK